MLVFNFVYLEEESALVFLLFDMLKWLNFDALIVDERIAFGVILSLSLNLDSTPFSFDNWLMNNLKTFMSCLAAGRWRFIRIRF